MKKLHLAILAVTLGLAFSASASLLVQVDEWGNGSYSGFGSGTIQGFWADDTITPAYLNVLTYLLPNLGGSGYVNGDVLLHHSTSTGPVSDLLRFNGGAVQFYSDIDATWEPADLGIPTTFMSNKRDLVEVTVGGMEGYWGYIPAAGNPGYNATASSYVGGMTYDFISVVPEPATFALMVCGLTGLWVMRRRSAT
jgi:hypothetical protein